MTGILIAIMCMIMRALGHHWSDKLSVTTFLTLDDIKGH